MLNHIPMMTENKIDHLIVDTGAFIKNVKVHELGKNIYTLPEVIEEIKDKATRDSLAFLPYKLNFRQPSSEIVNLVTAFSKKTGDYQSLSATDIKLVALTFQLEKEYVGIDHLRTEPVGQAKILQKVNPEEKYTPVTGFYQPHEDATENTESELVEHGSEKEESEDAVTFDEHESSDGEESNDEGWITEENIITVKKQMAGLQLESSQLEVACLTTDFAMQNVLLQMGLHAVSVDGFQIREAKTFIFRCYACFKTTSNMTKEFCPNCGNKTLKRVAVTVNEEGTKSFHINFKRPINIRGMRYSLPMPKSGRHAVNPILCEDQKIPQNRPSKLQLRGSKLTADDLEYLGSPFAINDVYSRAANLGIRSKVHHSRKNPNEKSCHTGNRKSHRK